MNRPRYRIQAVSRMTGVPSPTLRAWERRYGIPAPQRTDTAYRLYSDEDVELIRRLKHFTEQGMAPSEAADLMKRLTDSVTPPAPAPVEAEPTPAATDGWSDAVNRIVESVRRFDPQGLEWAVRQSLMMGSARTIFDNVFGPAMQRVGDDWHAGRISVAQEHMTSEMLGNATRDLLRLVQPDMPDRRAVLACVQGEHHVLPVYGTALHFVQWGYQVVMLGADTPPDALAHAVATLRPDVVGLSATQAIPREHAPALLQAYAEACGRTPWVVGGRGASFMVAEVEARGGMVARGSPESIRDRIEARMVEAPTWSHRSENDTSDEAIRAAKVG